jgi:DNA replication protein DnaC
LVASALLREIYDRYEVEGKLYDANRLSIKTLKAKGFDNLDDLLRVEFLVINNLGVHIEHDWFDSFVLEVLKGRYENLKPTVVITPFIPSYQVEDYNFEEKLSEEELEEAPSRLLNGYFDTPFANEIIYYLSRLTTPVEVKKPAEVVKELENAEG